MSAETLRRAAEQIRNDHGGVVSRNTRDGRRWLPVADWLDAIAPRFPARLRDFEEHLLDREQAAALTVARAYLDGAA